MSESHKLRVLIVGCGNIAGAFDYGRLSSDFAYTHAGAYSRDGRFILSACVDPDEKRRKEFMNAWGITNGYASIEEISKMGVKFDVISICSPTEFHAHDLEISIRLSPKLVFCEKPVTTSVQLTEKIVEDYDALGIHLIVNYTRQWDPSVLQLKNDMEEGQWGKLRSVLGIYNKGILNSGSHIIDLLHLLVGPTKVIMVGKPIYDYFDDDPTIPLWLEGDQGILIHLASCHAKDYAIGELQLVFEKGVLSMEEGGLFWRTRNIIDSKTFNGYRIPSEGIRSAGKYRHAMLGLVDNIYRAVVRGDSIISTGKSALHVQKLCEKIKLQSQAL